MKYAINTYPDTTTKGAFCWVAKHPDLPGCAAHARTLGEAKDRLDEVREAYLANLDAMGVPVPRPLPYNWHVDLLIPDPMTYDWHEDPSTFSCC